MKTLTAAQLAQILGATVLAGDAEALAHAGVCTDTRKLVPGCVFFALRGENFDANSFAAEALAQGAAVAIVSEWNGEAKQGAVILVPDTLLALQQLASWWRDQMRIHVIALTGSNGKTSTKDFAASVLSQKFPTYATRGNLNNHIGLPLTVLETTLEHAAAVYEMGMNHPGEIAPLTAIGKPSIAIITNIGSSHIEFMGSREGIAREKAAIAANLTAQQTLIIPHNCNFLELIRALTKARIFTTGGASDAVRAENIREDNGCACFSLLITDQAPVEVRLPVPGHHMVANALLAAATGNLLGISSEKIAIGLSQATLTSGRLRRFVSQGVTVFDDTYNANPESMIAGLETLAQFSVSPTNQRYAVLGRMAELGDHAAEGAQRVGEKAASLDIQLITAGDGAEAIHAHAGPSARHFATLEEAATYLQSIITPGDAALFKGSRSSAMEIVMQLVFPQ
jgi:UDP-N-acetylmuramoyl-tripeptide--D-alanyl-D-alanine ligase